MLEEFIFIITYNKIKINEVLDIITNEIFYDYKRIKKSQPLYCRRRIYTSKLVTIFTAIHIHVRFKYNNYKH